MFDRIADRYDRLNRILSLGLDQGWRYAAVRAMALRPGAQALDVATGTADLALRMTAADPSVRVVGIDPSPRMLAVGRRKAMDHGLGDRMAFIVGDAESLPFASARFAASAIAFGIRNVPDRGRALREMGRVTMRGGRVVVLELGEPGDDAIGRLARLWVRRVVPRLGGWLSGVHEYRYLQRSIAAFPPAGEFARLMTASGLAVRSVQPLGFGACTLFVAEATA